MPERFVDVRHRRPAHVPGERLFPFEAITVPLPRLPRDIVFG
jgi:hypothetical protein